MKRKTSDIDCSHLFLDFISSYGFDPNNYENILELYQGAKTSISQYLKDYRQFLLSERVKRKELEKIGIKGACGYLDSGIVTLNNKENEGIIVPSIDDFDVIISNGILPSMKCMQMLNQDKYIGLCIDTDSEEAERKITEFYALREELKQYGKYQVYFEHDPLYDGKEMYMIKLKK